MVWDEEREIAALLHRANESGARTFDDADDFALLSAVLGMRK